MTSGSTKKKMRARKLRLRAEARDKHIRGCAVCNGRVVSINGMTPVCMKLQEIQ